MPIDRMPEGEVAIRLAEHLLGPPGDEPHAEAAIDGAGVTVHGAMVFDIVAHLDAAGWVHTGSTAGKNAWTGTYDRAGRSVLILSRSEVGDVVARVGGRRVICECKKGPLVRKPGSPERPRLCEALGQALVLDAQADDIVVAAMPDTPAFRTLADKRREKPLVRRVGILIALVNPDGSVRGLEPLTA